MRFRCVMVIALTFLFSIPLFGQNAKKQVAPEDPESNISQIFRNKQLPEKVRTAIKNGLVGVEVEHYVGMREGFGEIVTFTVDTSGGTGFVVDSHLVLTANHIVNRSPEPAQNGSDTVLYFAPKSITVIKDGKKFKAKVVDFDSVKDLALLKVADDETNFSGTSFVFCNKPEFADGKGKPWIGFGFIQPKILLFTEFRYFEGYVESAMPAGEKQLRGFLEQSIQPGFSGGPVLDKNGYCLGILHGTYPIVSVFSPTSEIIVFLDKNKVKYHMK